MLGERRRRGRRALSRRMVRLGVPAVVAAVVVVLAVSAVAQISKVSGPYRRSLDRSFAALVGPVAHASNASGASLRTLLRAAPSLGRIALFSSLASLTDATESALRQFDAITPPDPAAAASGCGTALRDRAAATTALARAIEGVVGGPTGRVSLDTALAVSTVVSAGATLQAADGEWAACRAGLRRAPGGARLAASAWLPAPGVLAAPAALSLVGAVAGSRSLAPVHRLAILAVVTDPPAVASGGTSVVVPTNRLTADVVVANQGNVDEDGVEVGGVAQLQGAAASPTPVQRTVDIAPGTSTTLTLPGFAVVPGSTYLLQVTAESPSAGGAGPIVSDSVAVEVQPVPSTALVTGSATRVLVGRSVTFHATVVPSMTTSGTPGGTVEFEDDGAPVPTCATQPLQDGAASCTVSFTAAAVHAVSVVYSGDDRFAGSASPAVTLEVVAPG